MPGYQVPWQRKAAAKVAETKSKIPTGWVLSQDHQDRAAEQRQLTGSFIESFLEDEEVKIIRCDGAALAQKLETREYTSRKVTEAICKTAAIAHQIVSLGLPLAGPAS